MGKAEVLARALKNMTDKNTRSKIRTSLIRRQQIIFVAMIIVGVFLIATSQTVDQRLLNQGIAFIIVGFVGMWVVMSISWTMFDVGGSLKEGMHEIVMQTKEELLSSVKQSQEIQERIAKDTLKQGLSFSKT